MLVLVCHCSINSNLLLGGKDSEGSQTYKTCLCWEQPATALQIKVRASNLLRQPLSLSLSLLQDRVLFLTLNLSLVRSRSPLINVILFYISHFSWAAGSFGSQARTKDEEVGYWVALALCENLKDIAWYHSVSGEITTRGDLVVILWTYLWKQDRVQTEQP